MKKLTAEQVLSVYTGVAQEHFPVAELKPVAMIEKLLKEGAYEGLGLFYGEKLAAYALFAQVPGRDMLLLDYYAVLAAYRNGAVLTKICSRVYDVDFDIFAIPLAKMPSDKEAYRAYFEVYRYMLGEENYRRHVGMECVNN